MIRENTLFKRMPYCPMDSQFNNGTYRGSCAEYNSNNTWNFNGTNRCINNNNRYNANFRSRPVLDYDECECQSTESYFINLTDLIELEKECYNGKTFAIRFRCNYSRNIVRIWHMLNQFCVKIGNVHRFIIDKPKIREIVFCEYGDKLIQSFYVKHISEKMETEWFVDDSFSCRKGKGVMNAVYELSDYIRLASDNYTRDDVYLASIDIKNFFMSIDVEIAERLMTEFIEAHFDDGNMKNLLLYLTRILYRTNYSNKVIEHSNRMLEGMLPIEKSLLTNQPERGVPIGNWPSQEMGNFLTSFILKHISSLGYRFVHYTDDTAILLYNKRQFSEDVVRIEDYYKKELNLILHKNKRYVQHYSKGIQFLGRKVRYNRILPSNMTYNSVQRCVGKYTRISRPNARQLTEFMQSFNSYIGLLRTMNAYRIRKELFNKITTSRIGRYYIIDNNNYNKIVLKKNYTIKNNYKIYYKEKLR